MKKFGYILALFLGALLFAVPGQASAGEQLKVYVNGEQVKFDKEPFTEGEFALVQFRPIFERLGLKIEWDEATWSITGTKPGFNMKLSIGDDTAIVNGEKKKLAVKPRVVGDYTFVPLRFVGEATGAKVDWDDATSSALITQKPSDATSPKPSPKPTPSATPIPTEKIYTSEEISKQADRVVYIEVQNRQGQPTSTGSGFVVSSDGRVVTNHHVIDKAFKVKIVFSDGREYYTQRLLKDDKDNDLALLQIEGAKDFPAVKIGDSSKLKLGEQVLAIGSPLGLQNTASTGIVSTPNRFIFNHNYVQISVPIDHGSSGGALFNMKGEVVGVTTAMVLNDQGQASAANLNLAIPSSTLSAFLSGPENAVNMGDLKNFNMDDIQAFVQKTFGTYTLSNATSHFDIKVVPDDNGDPIIALHVHDYWDYSSLWTWRFNDRMKLPAFLGVMADHVHNEFGVDKVTEFIIVDMDSSFLLSTIPASAQTYTDGNWHVWYYLQSGLFDYTKNQAYFQFDPDGTKDEFIVNIH